MEDDAPFYATLAIAAFHRANLLGEKDNIFALKCNALALNLINSRLSDSSTLNSTLIAVSALGTYEVSHGFLKCPYQLIE